MALLDATGAPMEPPAITRDEQIAQGLALMLREMAKRAEKGEIDSITIVGLAKSGHPVEHLQIGQGALTMVGQLSQAQWRLLALINQPRGTEQ